MHPRNHFTLTVLMASILAGYGLFSLPADMSGHYRVNDIGLEDQEVRVFTDCFRLDMKTTEQQISDLQNAVNHRVLPAELEIFVQENNVQRVEIKDERSGLYRAEAVTENSRIELRPTTALMIASKASVPAYIDKGLASAYGEPICLENSSEV
ncbi:MAG: hypothetical protein ACLFTA_00430 [Candidatus Nanohaloarchaea archaeon]